MGCLWAAQLGSVTHNKVSLIVRENSLLLTPHGQQVRLTHLDQSRTCHPVTVVPPSQLETPIERLLVCTKAGSALQAMESVRQYLAPEADVLLLQNGMGSQQAVIEAFRDQSVWVGSTTEGAWLQSPLEVCYAGQGSTTIGSLEGKSAGDFLQAFAGCPLTVNDHSGIESVLWQKLAINCAINGLTALYDCQNGELLEDRVKTRMDRLIDEVHLVYQQMAAPVSGNLHKLVYDVCRKTANNHSSTCMDARLGRHTELAYINAYLIKCAGEIGLDLPAHRQLLDELSEKGVLW